MHVEDISGCLDFVVSEANHASVSLFVSVLGHVPWNFGLAGGLKMVVCSGRCLTILGIQVL